MFLSFFPTAIALMQGQVSCVLLLLFVGFHVLSERGRPFLGGVCLSLALMKFQLVLPVFLLYLLGRQFRVVCGLLTGGALLSSLSLLLVGTGGAREYLTRLHGVSTTMLRNPAAARVEFGMQTFSEPNLHGLIVSLVGSGVSGVLLISFFSLAVILWATRFPPTAISTLLAAMLVSYHLQTYDLMLLLLPISLLLNRSFTPSATQNRWLAWLTIASLAMLTAPVAPYVLVKGITAWYVLIVAGIMWASCDLSVHPTCSTEQFPLRVVEVTLGQ